MSLRAVWQRLSVLALSLATWSSSLQSSQARALEPTPFEIASAITELDVERARALLAQVLVETPAIGFERARLEVYRADCATAEGLLEGLVDKQSPEVHELVTLARTCAGATVGGAVVDDRERGIWIRFQDSDDQVLLPWIVEVAEKARAAMEADLNVDLPRPLRIDLVRDLFSLAAVSGLPLEAAETTGTVAVARWGRVTMISPRAAPNGYAWQDTLAHEIAHLSLTRATGDKAPLWLQEGIAKIQETRWRRPRVDEPEPDPDAISRRALLAGNAVGIDRIGPSIAMLPTADAAGVAFAEVESFVRFWKRSNGVPAFWLLLAELRQIGSNDVDAALRSTSGYSLHTWVELWQRQLLAQPAPAPPKPLATNIGDAIHDLRLAEVLLARAEPEAAREPAKRAAQRLPGVAAAHVLLSKTLLANHELLAARYALRAAQRVGGDAEGLALRGRFHLEDGRSVDSELFFEHALSLDPWDELVACAGRARVLEGASIAAWSGPVTWPLGEKQRTLCESVRRLPASAADD